MHQYFNAVRVVYLNKFFQVHDENFVGEELLKICKSYPYLLSCAIFIPNCIGTG